MCNEALYSAEYAKQIFEGVQDSFGKTLTENVIVGICDHLQAMTTVHMENKNIHEELQQRIEQSKKFAITNKKNIQTK